MALWNATAKTLKQVMPSLSRSRSISTSTGLKMRAYANSATGAEETQTYLGASHSHRRKSIKDELFPKGKPIGDYVPVYVALGMIGLSLTLGLHTAKQQLMHAPDVHVKKSRRETLPEVVEPEDVAHESEEFLNKSFFRKLAHIQKFRTPVADPIHANPLTREPRVESLKTVGVDPVEVAISSG